MSASYSNGGRSGSTTSSSNASEILRAAFHRLSFIYRQSFFIVYPLFFAF